MKSIVVLPLLGHWVLSALPAFGAEGIEGMTEPTGKAVQSAIAASAAKGGGVAYLLQSAPLCLIAVGLDAAEKTTDSPEPWLHPYAGPTRTDVDPSTLDGKVLCGYQGWFNTPGDGSGFGFVHWGQGLERTNGGRLTVDMWPDVSEYAPEDLREVPGLKMPDGSPARLYSAFRKGPVLLHFQWMRQYGIEGVFLSRFIGEAASPSRSRHVNQVLANVREGCHLEGRVWAMMLDLSTGRNATTAMVMNDWKFLCDKLKVREDSRYLHHQNKPVVLLWGLGFKDRPWSPEQGEELIHFFKDDPQYGGVYLIGGIDPHWRTLGGASRTNVAWAKVYRMFDSISPWNAGRYRDDASMDRLRKNVWEADLAELKSRSIGYMPTAFPGFSWDNLRRTAPGTSLISRRKGEFYWRQFAIFRELGIRTVFVGMFDEVDEGTAIYKVANVTPAGKYFVNYEGLSSDYYLKLTGVAARMIRGELPLSQSMPQQLIVNPANATINAAAETKPEPSWRSLPLITDGRVDESWVHVGWGGFVVDGDSVRTEPAPKGLGLLVYKKERFGNCQLRVVFKSKDAKSNSGVFVRIADGILDQINHPGAAFDRDATGKISKLSLKLAMASGEREEGPWFAVHRGYEVQIQDENDRFHRTGAIYSLAPSSAVSSNPPEQWETMVITLDHNCIFVHLNGKRVTSFDPDSPQVPRPREWFEPKRESKRAELGYIGLQNHDPGDIVWFKEVSVRPLPPTLEK